VDAPCIIIVLVIHNTSRSNQNITDTTCSVNSGVGAKNVYSHQIAISFSRGLAT
jgi:hypothetical protein